MPTHRAPPSFERPPTAGRPPTATGRSLVVGAALLALGWGCNPGDGADDGWTPADLAPTGGSDGGQPDAAGPPPFADDCGDVVKSPDCRAFAVGPPALPFPLSSDPDPQLDESDSGVVRDPGGGLVIGSGQNHLSYLWVANWGDLGGDGSVSKIDARAVREVARYRTVTCYSLPGGSTEPCDGQRGCCAIDDWPRYQARRAGTPPPAHQAVQQAAAYPSRTAVDFNGDLLLANRAFGGQSSVTRVAGSAGGCLDRNHNGRIDTSADENGDGFIQTDCNHDGLTDDLASVSALPCTSGLPQEFYGTDDECLLWTSNTFAAGAVGRPLGLGPGGGDTTTSDAWAGSYTFGRFLRVDGATGLGKDDALLPDGCHPYGVAIDGSGVAWAPDLGGGRLCYFDTERTASVGAARDPSWGQMEGYGVTLDRDQNIWVGRSVARYAPDRSAGFASLGAGQWTRMASAYGIGIAADARNADAYFVWACTGDSVLRVPASTLGASSVDRTLDAAEVAGWPNIRMPCYGVGVDLDQNVWGVDKDSQLTTRALVNAAGDIRQPVVNGPAQGNDICPAGDSCRNAGAYSYSDFTGFGLRYFTKPQGRYALLIRGCLDDKGDPSDTQWFDLSWQAELPANTSIAVHARSGSAARLDDPAWAKAAFTPLSYTSPVNLQSVLSPNSTPANAGQTVNDPYLAVELLLATKSPNATPRLTALRVGFRCGGVQ